MHEHFKSSDKIQRTHTLYTEHTQTHNNHTHVKALVECDDDWFNDDSQIRYLLFKNGVFDMKNFTMLPFDPKFTKRINRDFDTNRDYTDGYKHIFDRTYDKQFTNPEK
jgi:hypothetical protein